MRGDVYTLPMVPGVLNRPTIRADPWSGIAAAVALFVALPTKRLDRTVPKPVVIAVVRFDVVDGVGRPDEAFNEAMLA